MKNITFNQKGERVEIFFNKKLIGSYIKNKNLYYFSLNKLDKQIMLFEKGIIDYLLKNYILYKDFNFFIEKNCELSKCGKFYVYNGNTKYQSLLGTTSGVGKDIDDFGAGYYESLIFEPKEID